MRNDLLEWVTGVIILLLIATAGYAQLAEDSIAGVWLFEEGKGKGKVPQETTTTQNSVVVRQSGWQVSTAKEYN